MTFSSGADRRDENIGAAELQIDALLALLHGPLDLGAEHFFEPLRHAFGIGRAQVNVVPVILAFMAMTFLPVVRRHVRHAPKE